MNVAPIWLTEAEVVSLMDMGEAVVAIERGLAAEATASASTMLKTHLAFQDGELHAIGGQLGVDGLAGTKTWLHTSGGVTPLLVLYDTEDGSLRAVIEAFVLGQYRTAAISGVATARLAAADASQLAIIGTGKQALTQAAAVVAVRPIEGIRIYGRNRERRVAFANKVADAFGLPTVSAESAAEAVDGADVVTLITRATEPVVPADAITRGTHVNAVGAISLERAEFDPKLLARCSVVAADSPAQTRRLSSEFLDYYGTDDAAWQEVRPLSELVAARSVRPPDSDVTLFKAMGIGLADVALGAFCEAQARINGIGTPLGQPQRSRPRLRSSLKQPGVGYV